MPSTSPGPKPDTQSTFEQLLPGAPVTSLQSLTCFSFRHKSYVAYVSGRNLNILSGPTVLVQSIEFEQDLVAVLAESYSSKIVVVGKSEIFCLSPITEGWARVWWEKTLLLGRDDPGDETRYLSWGLDGEVLVGGNRKLSLFSTLPSSRGSPAAAVARDTDSIEERKSTWVIGLPSPIQHAAFSHSANMIATCGGRDCLVKIWRRLSFEEGLFDYFYLRHPATVTHLQWRPIDEHSEGDESSSMSGRQDEESEALYTIASDGMLRVWKAGGPHDPEMLVLHTTIDLLIIDPSSDVRSSASYTCILYSDHFHAAVNAKIGPRGSLQRKASQHLVDVSSRQPDIVISFDGRGRMSAWGLQSIGHKRRPDTPPKPPKKPYHITHSEDLPVRIPENMNARLYAWFEGGTLYIIGHTFNGEIRWWRGDVETFFSPYEENIEKLTELAYWSGHSNGGVDKLKPSPVGRGFVSHSTSGQVVHWRSTVGGITHKTAEYTISDRVVDLTVLAGGASRLYTLALEHDVSDSINVVLRDSTGRELVKSSTGAIEKNNASSSWRLYATGTGDSSKHRVIALTSTEGGYIYSIDPVGPTIETITELSLPALDDQDAMVHRSVILDVAHTSKAGVACITRSGMLILYHLRVLESAIVEPIVVATFETGVADCGFMAANNDFAAIVSSDAYELVLVNLVDGYVEHRCRKTEKIQRVVPAPNLSLVAVVYNTTVDVLAQGRIGYREEIPPWLLIKQVSIGQTGLAIEAVTWLGNGSLALTAGGAITVLSNVVDAAHMETSAHEQSRDPTALQTRLSLANFAQQLRRPVPIWHPTFLAHIIRSDSWPLVASLIERLLQKLKFWTEGDALDPLLNVPAAQLYGAEAVHTEVALNPDTVRGVIEQLQDKTLPLISDSEQHRLVCVLETLSYCNEHRGGLDNSALRFLFSWKLELVFTEASRSARVNGVPNGVSAFVPEMHWREIAFAYHSKTQQPLLEILLTQYENKWTWAIARRLGVFAWLSDREALIQIFEALAQSTYRSTSPPDPVNASLYFLALNKKQTLLGLWRIATWNKEQRVTMSFLRRDFAQVDNQTAARKNAYALLGKRRFEYAASFFLLAGDGPSAISVLAGQCSNLMLAIAVGRLEGGDSSPALRKLIQERLIPDGEKQGNRWLLSWCHSFLQDPSSAASMLIEPLSGARHWLQDEPATLTLYAKLRLTPSDLEFDAVLRAARILRRMGLWLSALELVSQWRFPPPRQVKASMKMNGDALVNAAQATEAHPTMLNGFVDEADPIPAVDEKAQRQAKAAELLKKLKAKKQDTTESVTVDEKARQPTQFKEPDSNSLLDSFGF